MPSDLKGWLESIASALIILTTIEQYAPRLKVWGKKIVPWSPNPKLSNGLLLVAILLLGYSIYLSHTQPKEDKTSWANFKFETISGGIFRNQKVVLDGRAFYYCTFDHVEFEYNGTAPSEIYASKFSPGIGFSSQSREVNGAFIVMKGLGLLNPSIDLSGIRGAEWPDSMPPSSR